MIKYCQVIRVIAHTQVIRNSYYQSRVYLKSKNDDTWLWKKSIGRLLCRYPINAAFRLIYLINKPFLEFSLLNINQLFLFRR